MPILIIPIMASGNGLALKQELTQGVRKDHQFGFFKNNLRQDINNFKSTLERLSPPKEGAQIKPTNPIRV